MDNWNMKKSFVALALLILLAPLVDGISPGECVILKMPNGKCPIYYTGIVANDTPDFLVMQLTGVQYTRYINDRWEYANGTRMFGKPQILECTVLDKPLAVPAQSRARSDGAFSAALGAMFVILALLITMFYVRSKS